ncbi:MAG: hypothetical protein NPINA01_33430 [Nitrospinaceae bacterium]|nr:MAG: hypothetical protein NPINA01_33430 [Nitrospinaceae bacterium]
MIPCPQFHHEILDNNHKFDMVKDEGQMSTERRLHTIVRSEVGSFIENSLDCHRFLMFMIPILCAVCMVFSGCDTADEQTLQSPTPFSSVETSQQRTDSASVATTRSLTQETHSMENERPRIVAFGDSLTAGLGVPPEESYPSRLQRHLDQAGYPYRVVNAGVSGDTTAGALRRLDWVLKTQPSIVIIELGANDGIRGQPIKTIYENLQKILQHFKDLHVTVLLTGMKIPPNYGFNYTSQFAEMYPQLADEFDVAFMPFFLEGVAAHRMLNQADGIHPTGEGYKVIVENLLTFLEPLLQTNATTTS